MSRAQHSGTRVASFPSLDNLNDLLDRHGVSPSDWSEATQRGFSGARIYTQANAAGSRYVLKTTSTAVDWIMRATSDDTCREAALANVSCLHDDRVATPAIASTQDDAVFSILMDDVSEHLLPNDALDQQQLDLIWRGMVGLHALPPPSGAGVRWCSVEDRLSLFEPDPVKLRGFRIADDILRGWQLFFEHAPKRVVALVRVLFEDLAPLQRALRTLPNCFLHGDLKLDNIGIRPDGSLCLIDWSMPMIAPAAIELGWFLAMNSRCLPVSLDDALSAYTLHSNMDARLRETHESLTILCGLLIRGWRKGLDAELGAPAELRWWCERASSAANLL